MSARPDEQPVASYSEQLDALLQMISEAGDEDDGDAVLDTYRKASVALELSGVRERARRAGEHVPRFELPDHLGRPVRLDDLLARGPVVISFYRGAWCPFCNLELRVLQQSLGSFEAAGATLVAISPHVPDVTAQVTDELGLGFVVLSDESNAVADCFGLVFDVIPEQAEFYRHQGLSSEQLNGSDVWRLPLPATYVVDSSGLITFAFVDLDLRQRAEPAEVLAAVRRAAGVGQDRERETSARRDTISSGPAGGC